MLSDSGIAMCDSQSCPEQVSTCPLVEVTIAAQPLPRLQAVGSADTAFPFIYDLNWGPRETFSTALAP